MHFELIFVYVLHKDPTSFFFFFCMRYPVSPTPFFKKTILSPSNGLGSLVANHLPVDVGVRFWALRPVRLHIIFAPGSQHLQLPVHSGAHFLLLQISAFWGVRLEVAFFFLSLFLDLRLVLLDDYHNKLYVHIIFNTSSGHFSYHLSPPHPQGHFQG